MTRCLRMPVFRRLLTAYVLNELAWSVGTLALSVLVYKRTGSALGSTSFFISAQFLPALVAPALVNRVAWRPTRRVLPLLYGVEGLLFAALTWFAHHFSLAPVLAFALADGVFASAGRALAWTARTQILKPVDLLHEGNAVVNFGFSAAYMAGPVIGGVVVATGGTILALMIVAALFAVLGVLLGLTHLPTATSEQHSAGPSRLLDGLRHARGDWLLSRLLIIQAMGIVFFTVTIPVEVIYAQHTLKAGPGGYGALLGAWGAGAVAGSVAYARWRRRSTAVLIGCSGAALALGYFTMALAPTLVVALIGSAVGGAGNGVESMAVRTAVQERTPDRLMALMMSLNDSVAQLAPGIGIVAGGVITELASTRIAFGVAGAGAVAFAVASLTVLRSTAARRLAGRRAPVRRSEEAQVSGGNSLV